MTRQSGSMNRYSKEQFTWRLLPSLRLCVAGLYWTAIVPDEPYRAKGLCGGTKFPPHLAHLPLPTCSSPSASRQHPQYWVYLRKLDSLTSLQPRKLGFHIGGSSSLLDTPPPPSSSTSLFDSSLLGLSSQEQLARLATDSQAQLPLTAACCSCSITRWSCRFNL